MAFEIKTLIQRYMGITRLSHFKYLNYVENLKFVPLLYHMAVTISFYGLKILRNPIIIDTL